MLRDKIKIKNLELKNRILAAPIVSNSGDINGIPTEKTFEIYEKYAQSGVGMVIMEQQAVHPWGRNKISQFRLYDDNAALTLEPLTKIFRKRNIPVVAQLNFAGARASGKELLNERDFRFFSPSGIIPPFGTIKEESEPLQLNEIKEIIDSFGDGTQRAIKLAKYSGGVQIYACHGYLIGQFLSPITNQRTDKYGGELKNRARILFEIVESAKNKVGDFPLSVRLGIADYMPWETPFGLTLNESLWITEELAKMGIDWLGISGNHCSYGIGVDDKDTGYFSFYSKAIKEKIKKYGVFVDCTGGIRTAKKAETMLKDGVCDLIGIGRPLMTNKNFLSEWDN